MNDWLSIESAPKDGTPILICEGDCYAVVHWGEYANMFRSGDGWIDGHMDTEDGNYAYNPDAWMPIKPFTGLLKTCSVL